MEREDLDRKVELAFLSAFYGGLLTEKQRQVLAMHCEEDLSISEIAQETGTSRQGVHDTLTRAARRLFDTEAALGAAARFRRMEEGLAACRAHLAAGRYDEAERALAALSRMDQEDDHGL